LVQSNDVYFANTVFATSVKSLQLSWTTGKQDNVCRGVSNEISSAYSNNVKH